MRCAAGGTDVAANGCRNPLGRQRPNRGVYHPPPPPAPHPSPLFTSAALAWPPHINSNTVAATAIGTACKSNTALASGAMVAALVDRVVAHHLHMCTCR